jgi:hypothetical protein
MAEADDVAKEIERACGALIEMRRSLTSAGVSASALAVAAQWFASMYWSSAERMRIISHARVLKFVAAIDEMMRMRIPTDDAEELRRLAEIAIGVAHPFGRAASDDAKPIESAVESLASEFHRRTFAHAEWREMTEKTRESFRQEARAFLAEHRLRPEVDR